MECDIRLIVYNILLVTAIALVVLAVVVTAIALVVLAVVVTAIALVVLAVVLLTGAVVVTASETVVTGWVTAAEVVSLGISTSLI